LWCARLNPQGEWEKWHITFFFVNKRLNNLDDMGDGRVFISSTAFLKIRTTIFPKNTSKLDPRKVTGLSSDSAS
jgi:hypothetical protein